MPPAVPPKKEISEKDRQRLIQRRNVIKELVDTEAVFVRDMCVVWEIYKGTAEACPKLDAKTIKLIFRNTDEIIAFHTQFSMKLREAAAKMYMPVVMTGNGIVNNPPEFDTTNIYPPPHELDDLKDFSTTLGTVFCTHIDEMKAVHEIFLRSSDMAAKRLIEIQQDPTVKVWLNECHEVAKDLTAAWDLDSLLIKPMQRITKYPNLIMSMLQQTPEEHPDRVRLMSAKDSLEEAIIEINKTKKNFELVGQIVSGKRKDSDVKAGIARAFGKRSDKMQTGNRVPEDEVYVKLNERFNEDFMRLQVVLRDAEDYKQQVSAYVHEFLQYLSSIELVMRLQPSGYPELESKWVQFNVSMRDIEQAVLKGHMRQIDNQVVHPFENLIQSHHNPALAMKKRQKRRLDYEKAELLKKSGKAPDARLTELVEQYEALNDTLKKELPILSSLTAKVGKICLSNLVNIQTAWYKIWRDRIKSVLGDGKEMHDIQEIMSAFHADFSFMQQPMTLMMPAAV
ncbi:Rho guanine nucleotide exchange factor gef1 [Ceratocystis platani]|uniref:Rho guanine nucleotide exchange factor gef1 n=1 Tax=Ceratocystis fimbriata f. sp. platani TaxID=88771 RepID=A0A0F8B1W5_CERFI|nr:Rho guanine nucleotide exchange factor gef1 [Ceratocystis platani]